MPFAAKRAAIQAQLRFPQIDNQPMGMFERGDRMLEIVEEMFLDQMDLEDRIEALEAA